MEEVLSLKTRLSDLISRSNELSALLKEDKQCSDTSFLAVESTADFTSSIASAITSKSSVEVLNNNEGNSQGFATFKNSDLVKSDEDVVSHGTEDFKNLCSEILQILKELSKFEVNRRILATTNIGVIVGRLRAHSDLAVKQAALELVSLWKGYISKNSVKSTSSTKGDDNSTSSVVLSSSLGATKPSSKHECDKTTLNDSSTVFANNLSSTNPVKKTNSLSSPISRVTDSSNPITTQKLKTQQNISNSSQISSKIVQSVNPSSVSTSAPHGRYSGPLSGIEQRDKARALLYACFEGRIYPSSRDAFGNHSSDAAFIERQSGKSTNGASVNKESSSSNCNNTKSGSGNTSTSYWQESPGEGLTKLINLASLLSCKLEEVLFREYIINRNDSKAYKNQLKSIQWNLRDPKNTEFHQKLLFGILSPERVALMSSSDMASSEKKDQRKRLRQEALEACQSDWERRNLVIKDGQFSCFKCKSLKTSFTQAQIRSADEPMTTFVTCFDCGNRWKF